MRKGGLMKFVVNGEMDLGGEVRRFSKEIEAKSESAARDGIWKLFGSQHGLKRNKINIIEVKKS